MPPTNDDNGSEQPLLAGDDEQRDGKLGRTPLPKFQLFLLCIVRLAEPVAYTQIFPYINDLCLQMGYAASEKEVGFISGLIDSIFAAVQLLTVIHWGRLSDRIGRRPVILMGLSGITLATVVFGFSRTLWLTIVARCMAGSLSGNGAVIQSMITEMTDDTNEAQAFPLYALMWAVGSVIGPTIGGSLARPAERFPSIFAGVEFWETYPYLLPCLVSACVTGVSIIVAFFFLKETLPLKVGKEENTSPPSYGTLSNGNGSHVELNPSPPPTAWQILRSPAVAMLFVTSFLMMFTNQSWDVVFILYAYTSIPLGGLSLSNAQIGYSLAGAGGVGACIHLFIFPRLQRRFGTPMYPYLLSILVLMYGGAPLLNWFVRLDGKQHARGDVIPATFVGVGILLILGRISAMVFPLNMILVKKAAPSRRAMGSTYGLAQMVTSSARAVSPWFVSSLFAWSVEKDLLGGKLMWLVMCIIVLFTVAVSCLLPPQIEAAERLKSQPPSRRADD